MYVAYCSPELFQKKVRKEVAFFVCNVHMEVSPLPCARSCTGVLRRETQVLLLFHKMTYTFRHQRDLLGSWLELTSFGGGCLDLNVCVLMGIVKKGFKMSRKDVFKYVEM